MDRNVQSVQQGIPVSGVDAAHANEYFEQFVSASTLKNIVGYYRGLIECLHLRPNYFTLFYPKLKANLTSWRAKALLKKFDSRASHKCYQKGKLASNTRVLVIGGGPCGLRTAIEAQLLGAKVVVVEKRDRFSRNNVLHLWPFVIEDLRMLGAKKFFGKFCAGAIDHISIRQLQCILLKVALLLGVEIHTEISFETLIEPNATDKIGWRAQCKPANHPVSQYEFDVVIGADGKRNTLQGFTRKEFRGKLAIAITANFINKKTEAEARVEEISGVAFIFNQKFFKDLQEATRIDLENIVYYKDDTHYFVMTAKKHSLIEKGVIKQDYADTEKLLAPENVDKEALQQYAIEAASFSTNYQMPNLEFAVNHYGQPDIAMFDFTSMYAAENASKVVERNGYRLLKILVGDSLLEPFWPTGSGCARGFLSSLDAAWAIRSWAMGTASPLDVMAERESIYRLLAQTTPDNLNKDWKSYTLDPSTRYPNLNKAVVVPHQVVNLFDTDNPASIDRMKRTSNEKPNDIPKKRRRGNVDNEVLINWLNEQLKEQEDITITDMGSIFKDGKVLCAIIHHYRPDLLDYNSIKNNDPSDNNQIAIDILEKDLGIPPVMPGNELTVTEDYLSMASYLTEIYDCFRGEIPHVKHPKLKLHSHIPKSVRPNRCHNTLNTFNTNIERKPCKKCFDSYNSQIKLCNNRHSKKKLYKLTQANFEVITLIDPGASSSKKSEPKTKKKTKTINIKNSYCQTKNTVIHLKHTKSSTLKSKHTPNDLPLTSKLQNINENSQKPPEAQKLLNSPQDEEIKCLEKMYHRHEKFKNILTRLAIKRKELNSKRNNLSVISETKNENKNNENESNETYNKSPKPIHKVKLESQINVSVIEIIPQLTVIEIDESKIKEKESDLTKKMINVSHDIDTNSNVSVPKIEDCIEAKYINVPNEIDQDISQNNLARTDMSTQYSEVENNRSLIQQSQIKDDGTSFKYTFCRENFVDKNVGTDTEVSVEFKSEKITEIECPSDPVRLIFSNNYYKEKCSVNSTCIRSEHCLPNTTEFVKKPSANEHIKIRVLERNSKSKFTLQTINYVSSTNHLTISSKMAMNIIPEEAYKSRKNIPKRFKALTNRNRSFGPPCTIANSKLDGGDGDIDVVQNTSDGKRQRKFESQKKFLSKKMIDGEGIPNQIYSRVSHWISSNDFLSQDNNNKADTDVDTIISNSKITDITSVSKMEQYDGIIVEERTDVVNFTNPDPVKASEEKFAEKIKHVNRTVKTLSKFSQYSPFQHPSTLKSSSAPPKQFSVIVEGEEITELPVGNSKLSELSFKTIKTASIPPMITQPTRPSSRHKHKHSDAVAQKAASIDRKPRKRRTLERVGASVMFNLFFNGFIEAGLVGILLFILDIIINSEQYGFQNYLFNT